MNKFSGLIVRTHGRVSLRGWDRFTIRIGLAFALLAIPLHLRGEQSGAQVSAVGGCLLMAYCWALRSRNRDRVWGLACADDDPVQTLALYEYLYRLPLRDLRALSAWRAAREARGLPVLVNEPHAPAQVHALYAHLCPPAASGV